MFNLNVTQNANQGFQNFALQYATDGDVKLATQFGTDYLDTVQDVNDYEKLLSLFLSGKITTTVERLNEDCTWRTEVVKFKQ
jgi:maltoporin